MKICFLTTISGTLKAFVLPQLKYYRQVHPEWELTVACSEDNGFEALLPEGVRYIPVKMGRGIDLGAFKTINNLKKLFKKEKFDMIVYATPNAAFYSSIAGKSVGVKKRIYNQWGIRYVGFSGFRRKIFKAIEKITCKNSTDINAVSHKNREFAISEGLYQPEKAKVVGNGGTVGVDLTVFDISKYDEYRNEKRAELGVTEELVFGFVGRLSRDKGTNELLTAFKKISGENKNVKLVCVGRNELKAGVISPEIEEWLKNTDKVVMTGLKPKEDVKKYYAAFDLYVHPTYREGFGLVLQEAGAMSCPVITTDIPGASEVLKEGVSCFLCKPRDAESLYETMKSVCEDKEKCREFGLNARKCVEEKYERSIMLGYQLKRFEELLGVE